MASRSKRRAVGDGAPQPSDAPAPRHEEEEDDEVEDGDEDDEDSDEGEDEDDEVVDEEVNIDFEAYSISDNDHDGIKKLLQQLFLKAPVNTAELTDLLIQQNHVGSVIKGTQCAEQIKELVLSRCQQNCEKSVVDQLGELLSDAAKPVGLLLSERFINVPPQVALPMHQQLQKELAEAHKTSKPCGKCYFYLLISKTFVEAAKNNSRKKRSGHQKEELVFANAEEEFFYELPLTRERMSDPEFGVCGVHCGSLCDVEGGPEVQLLGAGGERHTPGRQVGLRRRSDDTLAHGDADSVWRDAWDHGPAEGAPLSLALPVGSRVPVWANYQKAPWRCTENSRLHVDLDSLQKVGFCCLCL
ncbi:BRCA2 and CDKN1A-interacting protein isoform X3 [Desmodus rotundus]|uniref:BRCA2 and CDKN1A-interacting protein isoform X3 n=1 Tax=Desmodus rotundus TaxID=9430 RepID=UPI002380DD27|nr:BRCA2 and CDKN1A-interacting protein isoform X3 [Desmodus rotundus]